jgi:hypothetical protein
MYLYGSNLVQIAGQMECIENTPDKTDQLKTIANNFSASGY